MHHNELSLQLLDWLDGKCEDRVRQAVPPRAPQSIDRRGSMEDIKVSALRTEEDDKASDHIKLPNMPKVNLDEISKNSRQNDAASLYSAGGDSSSKQNNAGSSSNRMTPRGLSAAS